MSKRTFVVAVAASLLLVGCVQPPPVTAAPSPTSTARAPGTASATLKGDPWQLASLRGVDKTGSAAFLQFGDDGRVSGSGGCNGIGGSFTSEGSKLSFGNDFVSTMMACEESIMATERDLLAALPEVAGHSLAGGVLTLSDAAGAEVATFQTVRLAGTSWFVTGLLSGNAVSSPINGTELTVVFGEDGTLSGSGGCNRFTGGYSVTDGTLQIGPLASTAMACETPVGVMEQEADFIKALESATIIQRQVRSLTLRTAEDTIAATLALSE